MSISLTSSVGLNAMETPAVLGGLKVREAPISPRFLFGREEKAAVAALMERAIHEGHGVLGYNGPEEEAYCREFAEYMGGGFADGVNSGTNAIYVALKALELEPYGEVIVPPISDPGGIMPVALCNLIPVPADCAPHSLNTSAEQIAARITPRTRAILVAHVSGFGVDMDAVMAVAKKHQLKVVEDCAQCHGAKYGGQMLGTFGDAAAFSTMFGKHHSTGGQGGLVFTKNEEMYWRMRRHADRGKPFGLTVGQGAVPFEGNVLASLNCNMDELHACIGRQQLKKLPGIVRRRRKIAIEIAEGCQSLAGVSLQVDPPGSEGSYWFLVFHFNASAYRVDKGEFVAALQAEGLPFDPAYYFVPTRHTWYQAHKVFGTGESGLPFSAAHASTTPPAMPNLDAAHQSLFRLGIHEDWRESEIRDTLSALNKISQFFRK